MGHRIEEDREVFKRHIDVYVEVPTLFDPDTKGNRPRRVLVLGAAGSGKTTLIQHACEEWSADNLWTNFHYVFLLTCRRLNRSIAQNKEVSMLDLLLDHGPQLGKNELDTAKRELMENQEHTLVIIDGVDELAKWTDFIPEDTRLVRNMEEPAEIIVLFHSILGGHLMDKANFVFTSRPIDRIDSGQFERGVKIFGFGKEAIEKCILALSGGDEEKCRRVLEYLDQRPQLKLFCTLPLGCIMTGKVVFDEISDTSEGKVPHEAINCATLLIIRVLFVLLHKRSSQPTFKDRFDLIRQLRGTILKIMQLAAFGILAKSPQIIFDINALRDQGIEPDDLRYGLLDIESDQKDFSALPSDATCAFIHKSLQEFFTALQIAVTWKNKDIKMITSREASHQFNMVLLYLSGLLGNPTGHRLIQAIDETIKSNKLTKRLSTLFDKLVKEYEGSFRFLPTVTKKGKESTKLGRLQLIRCVAEGNNKALVRTIDDLVVKAGTLDLTDMPGGILLEHIPAIAFYLQSTTAVQSLVLEKMCCVNLMRMITAENQGRLVPLLDGACLVSGHFNLSGIQLSSDDMAGLTAYVVSTESLQTIDTHIAVQLMNKITPENQARLVPLLDGCVLEGPSAEGGEPSDILNLSAETLTEEDVRGIVQYLIHSTTIRELSLETIYCVNIMRMITPENQARLVPLLDGCVLEEAPAGGGEPSDILNLSGETLTEEDVRGIVQYLIHSTTIRELRFEKMYCVKMMRMITPENQARLVPLLDGTCLVSGHLDLRDVQVSKDDVIGLAVYVLSTKSLQTIGTHTAVQLMRGITLDNQTRLVPLLDTAVLTSFCLDLHDIPLTEDDMSALVTYILATRSLQTVEKYTAVELMRGITPDNRVRIMPLIDNAVLEERSDGDTAGRILNLEGIKLYEADLKGVLQYINQSTAILELSLRECGITDQGADSLAASLAVNTSLLELDLNGCCITDHGAVSLARAMEVNSSLEKLHLMGNMISDNGAAALASTLKVNKTLRTLEFEKKYCVSILRILTPANRDRLAPLLDGVCLVSGHLDLRGIKLSKVNMAGLVEYVLTTKSIQTIDTYTALRMMRGMTPNNQAQLVSMLDRCLLEGRTDGDTVGNILNLSGVKLSEADLQSVLQHLKHSRAILDLKLEKSYCVDLMKMITPENQARLVPLLDGCVLEGPPAEKGEPSCILNLSGETLTDEDVRSVSQYIEHSTVIRELRLEKMYCVSLMRIITPENQARLVPLLDGCVLGGGQSRILSLSGESLIKEDVKGVSQYIEHSTAIRGLRLKQINCLSLMGMITPENQAKLIPMLDHCVLQRWQYWERRGGWGLDLGKERHSEDRVRGLWEYIAHSGQIECIRLCRCGITDQEAAFLAASLELNNSLEVLDLYFNPITDRGAVHLASALETNKSLKVLDLRFNNLSVGKKNELENQFAGRIIV